MAYFEKRRSDIFRKIQFDNKIYIKFDRGKLPMMMAFSSERRES